MIESVDDRVRGHVLAPYHSSNGCFKYHPRQWVDRSGAAYRGRPLACVPEYHPRQWVDRSGAAYRTGGPLLLLFVISFLAPRVEKGRGEMGLPSAPLCRTVPEQSTHCRGWDSR